MGIDRSTGLPEGVNPVSKLSELIRMKSEGVDILMQSRIPIPQMRQMLLSDKNVVELAQGKVVTIQFARIPGFDLNAFCKEFRCVKGVGDSAQIGKVSDFLNKYFQELSKIDGVNYRWGDWHSVESGIIECSLPR